MENPLPSQLQPFDPKENNYHANIIIESRHEFSLLEKKIIYCVINQLKTNTKGESEVYDDLYFKIPISVFGADYKIDTLKAACDKLISRSITGGDYKKKLWGFVPFPWYEVSEGFVKVMLLKSAVPHFIDLKLRGYTAYKLDIALSLTSAYSQRMYELLSRFKDTCKWYNVEIEQLKFLLGINKEKCFNGPNTNGHLKARVLEPARLELAEKTDLEFNYSFVKEGRKFVRINFDIYTKKLKNHIQNLDAQKDKQGILDLVTEATQEQQMIMLHTALSQYNFTDKQKSKIIDNPEFGTKFMEINLQIMLGISKPAGEPTAYIAGILRPLGWS